MTRWVGFSSPHATAEPTVRLHFEISTPQHRDCRQQYLHDEVIQVWGKLPLRAQEISLHADGTPAEHEEHQAQGKPRDEDPLHQQLGLGRDKLEICGANLACCSATLAPKKRKRLRENFCHRISFKEVRGEG